MKGRRLWRRPRCRSRSALRPALQAGLVLAWLLLPAQRVAARDLNGFALDDTAAPESEIRAGGPKRDGIHSIDAPSFASPKDATWVAADTAVIGLAIGDDARTYPVHVMEYHQVVNDVVDGVPVVVTYDPLAGAPIAFRAEVDGELLHFGVSGLIYESNFLLYDRESGSLWSQMLGRAISGPRKGQQLERVRVRQEPFAVWQYRHPDTRVLERPYPKRIDYRYSRFSAYWISKTIPFPVTHRDDRFHPKENVLGLESGGVVRAYLRHAVLEAGGRIADEIDGKRVHIAFDPEGDAFSWDVPDGIRLTESYWFAWKTFHPDTEIWRLEGTPPEPAAEP